MSHAVRLKNAPKANEVIIFGGWNVHRGTEEQTCNVHTTTVHKHNME